MGRFLHASTEVQTEQERANFYHFVLDIGWFGLAMPATARFLSVYAIRLGATASLLGWMSALPAIIALATSGLTPWWRGFYQTTRQAQLWPGVGYRMMYLLPAFTPFFPDDWQPIWLIIAVSLPAIPNGLSGVTFLVLLRESVQTKTLNALMSRRSMVFNITVAISTLAFGLWLEYATFPINYQVMYVLAFGLSLVSVWHVQQVRELTSAPLPTMTQPVQNAWKSPAFRRVAFLTALTHVAFFSILPLITLRLVDDLDANEGFMSLFALAELSAAAFMAAANHRIVHFLGSQLTIAIGMIGTAVAGALFAVLSSLPLTLIPAALSGASWTIAAISLFTFFSENTPPEHATRYSTAYNQVVMLSVFAGPMLGSQLVGPLNIVLVMLLGASLRLLAGVVVGTDQRGVGSTPRPHLALRRAR